MKVETIVSEKKFEPVTFNVTVESLEELSLLWCRLNIARCYVTEHPHNQAYSEIKERAVGRGSDTIVLFQAVDRAVKANMLKEIH